MKKQLLLLSLSLLLASCGGTPDASQAASQPAAGTEETSLQESTPAAESTPTAETSSEAAAKTKAQIAVELFTKLSETGNCTFEVSETSTTQYLGGDKGILTVYDASQLSSTSRLTGVGYAKMAKYGIVSYYYVNDTAGVDATTTSVVSPNKNLTFEEFDNTAKNLGECGKVVTFTESSRTHTLTTSDSDFMGALLDFVGEDSEDLLDAYTTAKATITLGDNETELNVSYTLKGATDTTTYPDTTVNGMVIKNIGTTKNTNVETYLASNVTLTAPTAWNSDALELFAEASSTLTVPLPANLTYACSMPVSYDSDMKGYLLLRDLGCGNITAAYGTALVGAGFAVDAENTGTQNGTVLAGYTKRFESANPLEGATTLSLIMVYQTASAEIQKYYPNGVFAIYAFVEQEPANVTEAQVNAHLETFKLRWAATTNAFPTLTFGSDCTKLEFVDQTEAAEEYYNYYYNMLAQAYGYSGATCQFDLYCMVYAYYPTQAQATAAQTTIAAALTAAGYTESTQYPGSYSLSVQSSDWSYEVDLEVATDEDTGAYKGYLEVFLSASELTIIP